FKVLTRKQRFIIVVANTHIIVCSLSTTCHTDIMICNKTVFIHQILPVCIDVVELFQTVFKPGSACSMLSYVLTQLNKLRTIHHRIPVKQSPYTNITIVGNPGSLSLHTLVGSDNNYTVGTT